VVLRVVSPLEVKRLALRPSASPFWRSNARSLRIPSLTFIVVPVRLLSQAFIVWTAEEIDLSVDRSHFQEELSGDEQHFLSHIPPSS
jgi:hypothetical protein